MKKSGDNIISDIKSDDDLLFLWDMLVVYISAEWADKLLTDIVTLWLSIRGHSMAAAWLYEYKEAKEVLMRKKKGLRKELKKADTSTTGNVFFDHLLLLPFVAFNPKSPTITE